MHLFRIRSMRLMLAAGILGLPLAARADETVMFFERLSQTVSIRPPSQGGPVVSDSTRTQILVALGDHRLALYEPSEVWLYDFGKKRVQRVNTRDAIYSDWSLHAFVAFKEMELAQRLATIRGLRAAHPGTEPSVLDLESLFSIPARSAPGRRERLADSSSSDRVRLWINGRLAVEALLSDSAFAPGRAAMFDRFLGYQAHVHPVARRALLRGARVPSQIIYRYRDFNDETVVRLRLTRLSIAPEGNDPLAASKRVDIDDPQLGELNRRLSSCRRCRERGDWLAESRHFEAAAIDSGRWADAGLSRVERVLGGCERDSPWSDLEKRAPRDSALIAFRAGLSWRDSSSAAAALGRLDRVDGSQLRKAYVLDYLRGRARIATGDLGLGSYLMLGGLGGNPCMAGGWLDLGHGYLRAYQPVLAWMCLEAAEQTTRAPACDPRLGERAARERELEQRYPDLFE